MNKNALILTSKLVQDHEFIYPFYRLKEEGFTVHTYNGDVKQVLGYFGRDEVVHRDNLSLNEK